MRWEGERIRGRVRAKDTARHGGAAAHGYNSAGVRSAGARGVRSAGARGVRSAGALAGAGTALARRAREGVRRAPTHLGEVGCPLLSPGVIIVHVRDCKDPRWRAVRVAQESLDASAVALGLKFA